MTKLIDDVLVFIFKDGRSVPIDQLTNEELLYAIEFSETKLDKVGISMNVVEEKLETLEAAYKANLAKHEKELRLLCATSEKLSNLNEGLRMIASKKGIYKFNEKERHLS